MCKQNIIVQWCPCEATIHTSKESNTTDNSPSECPFPNDRLGHAIANMIHTGTYTWCDAYWKSDTFTFSETIPLCPKGPCGEQYQHFLAPRACENCVRQGCMIGQEPRESTRYGFASEALMVAARRRRHARKKAEQRAAHARRRAEKMKRSTCSPLRKVDVAEDDERDMVRYWMAVGAGKCPELPSCRNRRAVERDGDESYAVSSGRSTPVSARGLGTGHSTPLSMVPEENEGDTEAYCRAKAEGKRPAVDDSAVGGCNRPVAASGQIKRSQTVPGSKDEDMERITRQFERMMAAVEPLRSLDRRREGSKEYMAEVAKLDLEEAREQLRRLAVIRDEGREEAGEGSSGGSSGGSGEGSGNDGRDLSKKVLK